MSISYKNLYSQVNNLIDKRIKYNGALPYKSQQAHTDVAPFTLSSTGGNVSVNELVGSIMEILEEVVPQRIIEGLSVEATSPISANVTVRAGTGTAGGSVYTLESDTTCIIPFNKKASIFYVNLYPSRIVVETSKNKLALAKIIVPKPGTTAYVQDTKDESWNAYIQSFKTYNLYGTNDIFEEDTVELLRTNIGSILADNLIGNIRLTEDLKIINTAGTLELDSREMKLLDENKNVLMKLNRNGTFFYDNSGIEVAKFAVNGARVGNIRINTNNIESTNFVSNSSGFRISDNGKAEFEDVRIRGLLKSTVFEYSTVSAVGGQVIVGNSSQLVANMLSSDTSFTVDQSVFSVNDVVILRDGSNREYMLITDISNAPTYSVTRDLSDSYLSGETLPIWYSGTAVASTGSANSGYIVLDATSEYSPFIDINYRNSSIWNDVSTKVRLGNLAGISDPDFGDLSGFGLYSDNVYLKGTLWATVVKTADTGSRIYMDTNDFIAYDDDEHDLFHIYLDNPSSGYSIGDLTIGDYTGGNGIFYDASESMLTIRGAITADDITAGHLSASYLTSGTIGNSTIYLDIVSSMASSNYVANTSGWKLYGSGEVEIFSPIKIELADYSGDMSFIKSGNFVIGESGWRLSGDGSYQFDFSQADFVGVLATKDGGTGSSSNANQAFGVVILDSTGKLPIIDGSNLTNVVEPGTIFMWAGTIASVPSGWLFCNGAQVSRSTYSNLFNIIGEQYGAGDSSTTFNIPDFRDYHPIGATSDDSGTAKSNAVDGAGLLKTSNGQVIAHTHTYESESQPIGGGEGSDLRRNTYYPNTGSTGGTKNVGAFVAVPFIIKY